MGRWCFGEPQVEIRPLRSTKGTVDESSLEVIWIPHELRLMCGVGAEELFRTWPKKEVKPPSPGSRWIVFGMWSKDEGFRTTRVLEYSPVVEQEVTVLSRQHEAILQAERAERERERRLSEADRRRWQEETTAEAVAQMARKADFVGVGRVVSGSAGLPTFEVKVLKGRKRYNYKDGTYSIQVRLPEQVHSFVGHSGPTVLLFAREHGMDGINGIFRYPLLAGGVAPASEELLQAANDAISNAPRVAKTPFCLIHMGGWVRALSIYDELSEAFRSAGEGFCHVAEAAFYTGSLTEAETGRMFLEKSPDVDLAVDVLVRQDPAGGPSFLEITGLKPGADEFEVVGHSETWPVNGDGDDLTARATALFSRLFKADPSYGSPELHPE